MARQPKLDSAGDPLARKLPAMGFNLKTLSHGFKNVALEHVLNEIEGLEQLEELRTSDSGSAAATL